MKNILFFLFITIALYGEADIVPVKEIKITPIPIYNIASDIIKSDNDKFLIVGESDLNIYLIKIDKDGKRIWKKTFSVIKKTINGVV